MDTSVMDFTLAKIVCFLYICNRDTSGMLCKRQKYGTGSQELQIISATRNVYEYRTRSYQDGVPISLAIFSTDGNTLFWVVHAIQYG